MKMEVVCHELIVMTRVAGDIQSSSRRNFGGCRLGLKPLVRPGDRIRNHPLCIPALYLLSLSCCGYLPREPLPFSFEKDGSLALKPSAVKVNIFLWLYVQRIVSIYMHLFLLYRLSSQEWESFTLRFIQRYESAWSGMPFSRLSCEQRQPTRGYGGQNTLFFFFHLSTRASTSCPPSTWCHCDFSLEWSAECGIREPNQRPRKRQNSNRFS